MYLLDELAKMLMEEEKVSGAAGVKGYHGHQLQCCHPEVIIQESRWVMTVMPVDDGYHQESGLDVAATSLDGAF